MNRLFCLLLIMLPILGCGGSKPHSKIYLWVWERKEDLQFLDTARFGVAYLAASAEVDPSGTIWKPRRQPLDVPKGIELIPVIRIENKLESLIEQVDVAGLATQIRRFAVRAKLVQLDFDARVSERAWYAKVLHQLRETLPDSTKLSITSLASWSISDPWIDTLPIVEAVPMFFDMGVDDENVIRYLRSGGEVKSSKARNVYGLALDELIPVDVRNSRLFLFSPNAWSKNELDRFLKFYGIESE